LKIIAENIQAKRDEFARLITSEMGKPLREAYYEIDKTLTAFDYYIPHAEQHLAKQFVQTNASKSYIAFEPLGVILSVMPWNFPFWQVFRFAVPSLMAGNVTVLKHAPNVPQCADAIHQLFQDERLPKNLLVNYCLTNEDVAKLIAIPEIAGVSFTGSDTTGAIIAGLAGQNIKKCVVELGGNDPFIVLDDADLDLAIAGAIKSRSINSGQSCNAAKRFIVNEKNYYLFIEKLTNAVNALKVGNPMLEDTNIGPIARKDLAEKVRAQITKTIAQGAKAIFNPAVINTDSNFIVPTILTDVTSNMCAFQEEIFGPVWTVIKANSISHAIELANDTVFGLGASIWTADEKVGEDLAPKLQSGNVFINDIVKSDARLPFGGIKRSGFGRELSEFGLREFVNVKTVYIR
jgi:succinate-semialdehyde dehydrogenase/glutarate-semialdehyde dehydrogenase